MKAGVLKRATIMPQRAWAIFALLLSANAVSGAESLLDKRVRRFIIHGKQPERSVGHEWAPGLPGAFRNLARHAGVPIGIEALPSGMAGKEVPIEIDARNKTAGEILEQMVWQDRRYIFRERLGVIEVLPAQAELDPANCLNMLIPKLIIADLDWDYTFQSLRCQIDRVSRNMDLLPDPMRALACSDGGSRAAEIGPPDRLQATFENESVRDILAKLSAMVGDMAWYASFDGTSTACENLSLRSYRPLQWHPSGDGNTYSKEYPKECLACHYHNPN